MDISELRIIFAERLKDLMLDKNLNSISDLSNKINIPRPTISRWLNMTRSPQIDSLVLIAKFFDVSIDYLLGLED